MGKTSSLPKPLKTLLLSLAVSDVGVGLLAQPLYIVKIVNPTHVAFHHTFKVIQLIFTDTSFLSVVAISVDRFLAIHLHLRYQELVTHKRVVAMVFSIWILSLLFAPLIFYLNSTTPVHKVMAIIFGLVSLLRELFIPECISLHAIMQTKFKSFKCK